MAAKRTLEDYFQKVVQENEHNIDSMKYELLRLKSFVDWPVSSKVHPIRLSASGFYYLGKNDTVRCFACKKEKNNWNKGDNPMEIHRRLDPQCQFLLNVDEVNIPPVLPENYRLPEIFDKIKDLCSGSSEAVGGDTSPSGDAALATESNNSETQTGIEQTSIKSHGSDSGSFEERIQAERGEIAPESVNVADDRGTFNQLFSSTSLSDQLGSSLSAGSLHSTGSDRSATNLKQSNISGNKDVSISSSNSSSSQSKSFPGSSTSSQNQASSARDHRSFTQPSSSGGPVSNQTSHAAISGSSFGSQTGPLGTLGKRDAGPLKVERNRLETFRNWPANANVTPQELAKSGFFYTGQGDRVQCVFCKGILRNWDPGDKPHIEHRNKYARCPFILGTNVGNVPLAPDVQLLSQAPRVNVSSEFLTQAPASMESLGISTERPKHPNYAVEGNRIATFNNSNWPTYKHQTPSELAKAGFFYAGFGDNVKCFFCDGGLKNWEPGDDPWEEHTRWFPRCPFVKSVKGEQYINEVQNKYNGGQSMNSVENTPKPRGHNVEEREIKARMETPLVMTVLNTGVNRRAVMVAIEQRLRETGNDFPNAQALMDKVLELEESGDLASFVSQGSGSGPGSQSQPSSGVNSLQDTRTGPGSGTGPESGSGPRSGTGPGSLSGTGPGSEAGSSSTTGESGELERENRLLKEQKTCKICLDNEVGVVFLPCGHLCCCVTCAPAVSHCPICRSQIRGSVRTYIP